MSSRLETLASFYHQERVVWDVGCDHGDLGLSLLETHEAIQQLNLVDVSPPVVDSLIKKIQTAYIPKGYFIKTLLLSGEKIQLSREKEILFLAGMGGRTILSILSALLPQWHADFRVIISPHTELWKVRRELSAMGFKSEKETVVKEGQHFYQILSIAQKGNPIAPFGDELWQSKDAKAYREHLLVHYNHHRDDESQKLLSFLKGLENEIR